jgi:hemolysin activation/secretion protein
LTLALAGGSAWAQVPTSQTGLPTREEVNRAAPGDLVNQPPKLKVQGGIERAPCPLADPRFAEIKVTLTQAVFDNLKVVDPADLRPAYEDYLGKEEPIAVLCEIRDAAATILRRRGYLAAVQVPAQKIDGGVVHFDVLMAKIVAIQVRGNAGRSERLIAGYLDALKSQPVFNENDAERYLLLARDLPGYDVRMTLRPAGTAPGEVIGEIAVTKVPFEIDANVQNYGSHSVGPLGGLIRGEAYDVIGAGDRVSAGFYSTPDFDEQHVVQLGYDLRLGSEGLTVSGRFAYAWTEPTLTPRADVRSRTLIGGIEASYPLIRRQATNVRLAGGMDFVEQRTRFAGTPLNLDKIRVLYGRLDAELIDPQSLKSVHGFSGGEPRWRVAGSLEVRKGLNILGASDDCGPAPYAACPGSPGRTPLSRIQANPDAAVIRFSGTAEFRPVPDIAVAVSPRAQYSGSSLVNYEQFAGGNFTVGRGYDPGAIIGDSGVGFTTELRLGALSPHSRSDIAWQPFVFYDRAWTWDHVNLILLPKADPQELSSIGGGVRVAWGDHVRLELTGAMPLRRATLDTERRDARVLFSISTKLFPWMK